MMVLDAPPVHHLAFQIVAFAVGAKYALYYHGLERLTTAWTDQYAFSGNGDGTTWYPGVKGQRGFTDHVPVSSARVKLLREASFMIEYFKAAKTDLSPLVKHTMNWSKDYAAYQRLRDQAAEKLQ